MCLVTRTYSGISIPNGSLVDMCFKHCLKCYDDVLAQLKRDIQSPSHTADFVFLRQKEILVYAVLLSDLQACQCLTGCQSKLLKYDLQNLRR